MPVRSCQARHLSRKGVLSVSRLCHQVSQSRVDGLDRINKIDRIESDEVFMFGSLGRLATRQVPAELTQRLVGIRSVFYMPDLKLDGTSWVVN